MKSTGVLAMALFVTTAATSLHASDNQENLQRCRAAIEDSLGENTATRLYDIRNRRGGGSPGDQGSARTGKQPHA